MRFFFFLFAFIALHLAAPLESYEHADYQEYHGKWMPSKWVPRLSLEEHLAQGRALQRQEQWRAALDEYLILTHAQVSEQMRAEALFGAAVCRYHLGFYEEASESLNDYLNEFTRDQRYNDIFELKFKIAEAFAKGAKRRMFGWRAMPSWFSAKDLAIDLFDEIVTSLPRNDLAARALIAKANVLRDQRQFHSSNQALAQLINDFDRHPLVLKGFEELSNNYLVEMKTTSRSEEVLELAKINRQKMSQRFPNADSAKLTQEFQTMRELYAQGLFELAVLYHKKGYKEACNLYLGRLSTLYADTKAGLRAQTILKAGRKS